MAEAAAQVLAQTDGSFWMPPSASSTSGEVDYLFYLIFYISLFFFVLIVALMVLFIVRYRYRPGVPAAKTSTHSTALELTWSGIPLALVVIIFFIGFRGYMRMQVPEANAYDVHVFAQKWKWLFQYPNGHMDEDLHVPVNTPVKLTMESADVIHSFYVPAFRLKRDVVPGRYSQTWFRATQPGTYTLYCAEYCGKGHSDMLAHVIVHPPGEFEAWQKDAADLFKRLTPVQVGERLVKLRCSSCHTVDGRAGTGPSFKNIFGEPQKLRDGSTVTVDENYIRESILSPGAKIVAGYENLMPTFKGMLSDRELSAIIDYIRSLREPTGH